MKPADLVESVGEKVDAAVRAIMVAHGAVAPAAPWGSVRWPSRAHRSAAIDDIAEAMTDAALETIATGFEPDAEFRRLNAIVAGIDWTREARHLLETYE